MNNAYYNIDSIEIVGSDDTAVFFKIKTDHQGKVIFEGHVHTPIPYEFLTAKYVMIEKDHAIVINREQQFELLQYSITPYTAAEVIFFGTEQLDSAQSRGFFATASSEGIKYYFTERRSDSHIDAIKAYLVKDHTVLISDNYFAFGQMVVHCTQIKDDLKEES